MDTNQPDRLDAARLGLGSSWLLALGVLCSGPLTVVGVSLAHPQPVEWLGVEAYARAFHPLQLVTYGFGFLIVLGSVGLVAALHRLAPGALRFRSALALAFAAAFAAVIGTNYMLQLAVLRPNVAAGRLEGMALLAFNNPDSITMALEMLGYGFLGLATWAVAPVFQEGGLERWTRALCVANGVVSVAGTALHAAVGVRGLFGLALYAAWNVLFAALAVLWVVVLGRWAQQARGLARSSPPA